jgi:excisionase family DNA binding protein
VRQFYTTRQVADLLGVSAPTVIKWVENGSLVAHRTPGGHRRISHEALSVFSKSCGRVVEDSPASMATASDRICVLVVDTEPDFGDTVAEYLSIRGEVDVVQAVGALDVGYAIGAHKPDVVLYDLGAHGVEIRDIVTLLASHGQAPRLFMLTSILDDRAERLALQVDGCELIQKPVKLDRLWRLIRSA